jgi:hypothetical protein
MQGAKTNFWKNLGVGNKLRNTLRGDNQKIVTPRTYEKLTSYKKCDKLKGSENSFFCNVIYEQVHTYNTTSKPPFGLFSP